MERKSNSFHAEEAISDHQQQWWKNKTGTTTLLSHLSLSSAGCPSHRYPMERWGSFSPSGRLPTSSLPTWLVECLPGPQVHDRVRQQYDWYEYGLRLCLNKKMRHEYVHTSYSYVEAAAAVYPHTAILYFLHAEGPEMARILRAIPLRQQPARYYLSCVVL